MYAVTTEVFAKPENKLVKTYAVKRAEYKEDEFSIFSAVKYNDGKIVYFYQGGYLMHHQNNAGIRAALANTL